MVLGIGFEGEGVDVLELDAEGRVAGHEALEVGVRG